jgi:hypothetical protein
LFGRIALVGTAFAFIGLLAYSAGSIIIDCSAEPIYVPPSCNDPAVCGDGRMIFACDGPGGVYAYVAAYILCPVLAAFTVLASIVLYRKPDPVK